ncbi:hypothetical protein COP2_038742 [Malus domestica]
MWNRPIFFEKGKGDKRGEDKRQRVGLELYFNSSNVVAMVVQEWSLKRWAWTQIWASMRALRQSRRQEAQTLKVLVRSKR